MSSLRILSGSWVCLILVAPHAWSQEPPYPEVRKRTLQTVTEFARAYLDRLPDFTCLRTTRHSLAKAGTQDWHTQAKVASELSYYDHQEHYQIVAVNDLPTKKVPFRTLAQGWVDVGGNFGGMMSYLFGTKVQPNFEWHGWDYVHGKRAMVFAYHVALADSGASSTRCVSWIAFQTCKSLKYGFHGLLFVDQESLDILRITHVPEDLPLSYVQGTTSVDYGRVTVASQEYLLPVADEAEDDSGKTLFRNESSYSQYRKFEADSTLRTIVTTEPEGAPAKPPVKTPSTEREPVHAAQCFEARDAATRAKSSAMARATVAASFDDRRQAEKELLAVIQKDPDSDEATLAHVELAWLLERSGQARQAQEHAAQAAAGDPNGRDRKESLSMLEALARYPQQSTAARGYSRLPLAEGQDGLATTLSVNGRPMSFVVDTGAEISSISEAHAQSAGMTIRDDRFSIMDVAGKAVTCRLALADELTAGHFRLRNVPFCVLRGDPSNAVSPDASPDLLGLPVLLAFETVRFKRGGSFEIGLPSARKNIAQSNVCFEDGGLVVQVDLGSRHLAFNLDTGNGQTFLYPDFAEDFAEVAKSAGAKQTYTVQGLGEAVDLDAVEVPRLQLGIAGVDAMLDQVPILMAPVPSRCLGCYGNAGRDLLNQARSLTLDFKAMKAILER
jgi:predicted aspartyl protease